jgi:hypothetical protein
MKLSGRICRSCTKEKTEEEFYPSRPTICKECEKHRNQIWRRRNPEKRRLQKRRYTVSGKGRIAKKRRDRRYAKTANGKAYFLERNRRRRRQSPQKSRAHDRVKYAVKTARLIRSLCEICGDPNTEAHHPDYSRPLDVKWLCKKHHLALHASAITFP